MDKTNWTNKQMVHSTESRHGTKVGIHHNYAVANRVNYAVANQVNG